MENESLLTDFHCRITSLHCDKHPQGSNNMKSFILIVTMGFNTASPTVSMQRFESHSACSTASLEVVKHCTTYEIDGGVLPICFQMQNIDAHCIPAK